MNYDDFDVYSIIAMTHECTYFRNFVNANPSNILILIKIDEDSHLSKMSKMKPPEYPFVCSLVAGDESEGEVVGIGGGAQAGDGIRFVVSVWSPRPPGGRGGFQGARAAIIVPRATTQPVDPLVAPELHHLFFFLNTSKITAPPPGSPSVSIPEQEQS